MLVINLISLLLAVVTIYGVLIVPIYNFATRPVKAGRDVVIVIFSVIFTAVILQIILSVRGDLLHWLG